MAGPADGPHPGEPEWARELLGLLRPAGRDLGRAVAWLAASVDAEVSLRDDGGLVLAGDPTPLEDALVADLVSGRVASAAWHDGERHARLVRIELPCSAGVLAVTRTAPFDRRASEIVGHTATVLELLLAARESTATGIRLRRAAADLRLAVLQLLMVEDTVAARRVAAGLWPGLLDTDSARVYVVESPPEDRDRAAEECREALREQALVVRCPAIDAHVIVVAPAADTGSALRDLVGRRPGAYLGGSTRQGLARTATAYGQAASALAVARFRPDRTAVYAERTRPERLMDPAALAAWATRLLGPLDVLPHHTAAELLATTRLGLEFTAVNAAKVLGVSRNTVRARMARTESLLHADFTDLGCRAMVHLALNTQVALRAGAKTTAAAGSRPGDLLAGSALRTWADDLLRRLDADARDLRRTLRVWIGAGGNAERAAHLLGVHAQTVREHVRAAEPLLERQLLSGGRDLYEVVLAHLAGGLLELPAVGAEEEDVPDRLVHG
ncbi:helix-turn-helix domain-containing protein [Streptomyces sp. MS06]|uniref:helix-turn-helix domain-containing protein n=1 Tax=Streptomyces sp. MS06 TaxID=3385974 RepID=UPI0039A1B47F